MLSVVFLTSPGSIIVPPRQNNGLPMPAQPETADQSLFFLLAVFFLVFFFFFFVAAT